MDKVCCCDSFNHIRRLRHEYLPNKYAKDNFLEITKHGVPIRRLFISDLDVKTTNKDLITVFSKYGNVESCYLKRNQRGKYNNICQVNRNYAFITFSNTADALKARIDACEMLIVLNGRILSVAPAHPWHQLDLVAEQYYYTEKDWNYYIQSGAVDTPLNDDCLKHIFRYLPILDKIRIERVCKRWRAISLQSWSTVNKLDLSQFSWAYEGRNSRCIDTFALRKVLLRCGRYLSEINLSNPSFFSLRNSTLKIISKLCPNLQVIDISSVQIFNQLHIRSLRNCHNITKITLYGSDVFENELINLFKGIRKLRSLIIVSGRMSGKCLLYLPPHMEEISLNQCIFLNGYYLADALLILNNLKKFVINRSNDINENVLYNLRTHFQTLKELKFSQLHETTINLLPITHLTNLEVLDLSGILSVTDEFLSSLASYCKCLTYMNLHGCWCVTNTGLIAIRALPKLETLIINRLDVTDDALDRFNLKHFECQRCSRISDSGICQLILCSPQLQLLDLSKCPNVTNTTLETALIATKRRCNTSILKIYVGGTNMYNISEYVSPFLQIVNVDLSVSDDVY